MSLRKKVLLLLLGLLLLPALFLRYWIVKESYQGMKVATEKFMQSALKSYYQEHLVARIQVTTELSKEKDQLFKQRQQQEALVAAGRIMSYQKGFILIQNDQNKWLNELPHNIESKIVPQLDLIDHSNGETDHLYNIRFI